jgi:hypothetical protein
MTLCTDGVLRFWRLSSPHLPAFPATNSSLHWFVGHEMHGSAGAGAGASKSDAVAARAESDFVGAAWIAFFDRRFDQLTATKFADSSARILTVNRRGDVGLW